MYTSTVPSTRIPECVISVSSDNVIYGYNISIFIPMPDAISLAEKK